MARRREVHCVTGLLLIALMAISGVGCAGKARSFDSEAAALHEAASVDPIINTAAFGEQNGLEIRWWVVRDDPQVIQRVVEPYLNQPLPTDDATIDRLRRAGLRLVAAPMADLLGVRARMPIVGRIDRRWVGQAPRWIECVPGPRFASGRTVRIGHERLTLRPGALRFLTRAWTEPHDSGARLRFDLAMQHVEARRLDAQMSMMEQPERLGVLSDGMVFATTIAELQADGVFFYLLIPENPDIDWGASDSEEKSESSDDPSMESHGPPSPEPLAWTPEPMVEEGLMQGPPAAGIPTLGEAMLIEPAEPGAATGMRAVIVLIPRIAGDARLLP